jgi:hypothetical protein
MKYKKPLIQYLIDISPFSFQDISRHALQKKKLIDGLVTSKKIAFS